MTTSLELRNRRKTRIRSKLRRVSPEALRLSIFRSNKNIYAQLIDDTKGCTLVSASTIEKEFREKSENGATKDAAALLGAIFAERMKSSKIDNSLFFDRSGYIYHGRVKAFADAVRLAGLKV